MKTRSPAIVVAPNEIALPAPLLFDEFTKLESVSYFLSQLRRSRLKNLPIDKNNFEIIFWEG